MPNRNQAGWMLAEAIDALTRAERMHRELFRPQRPTAQREPAWEPPVDVLETDRAVLVLIALPGVDPNQVTALIEDGCLLVQGKRVLPPELRNAVIHRLELPQGRFERRILLPTGRYSVRHFAADGCLVVQLDKIR